MAIPFLGSLLLTAHTINQQEARILVREDNLAEMGPERLVRRVYEAEMEGRGEEGSQGENGTIILSNNMFILYI